LLLIEAAGGCGLRAADFSSFCRRQPTKPILSSAVHICVIGCHFPFASKF